MTPLQKALERLEGMKKEDTVPRKTVNEDMNGRTDAYNQSIDKVKTLLPEILKEVEEARDRWWIEQLKDRGAGEIKVIDPEGLLTPLKDPNNQL